MGIVDCVPNILTTLTRLLLRLEHLLATLETEVGAVRLELNGAPWRLVGLEGRVSDMFKLRPPLIDGERRLFSTSTSKCICLASAPRKCLWLQLLRFDLYSVQKYT